ncbi:MAG: hypothetical protein CMA07_06805 [Euryarchaeota archaeon]|nr:hypothetical protein [Euryarchaeota archaeon]|tara:strand:- start:21815 stop:22090 length:276 start_codon:yes stop_codon:yes gene_type:complete
MITNVIALRSNEDLVEFRNYVLSFYAYDGIYPIEALTVAKVESAIQDYIKLVVSEKNHFEWGYGDSIDRERVRDLLLKDYHIMKMLSEVSK